MVKKIEDNINEVKPALILTHAPYDHHQDHIAVAKSTIAATRGGSTNLLFYPPVNTKESFPANFYVNISKHFKEKILIISKFVSQQNKWYIKRDVLKIRAKETGLVANFKYAEKFYVYFATA